MTTRKYIGKGNRIPAMGIHVTKKQPRRYANWKRVKVNMYLKGTDSTKEGCAPSKTLPKKRRPWRLTWQKKTTKSH